MNENPELQNQPPNVIPFTADEQAALRRLRSRYRRDRDLFDQEQMAGLRFMRWLRRSGRLVA